MTLVASEQANEKGEPARLHEEAGAALDACEDRLLGVAPPDLGAAAYQLKVFAERFHSTDVETEPLSGEDDIEGPILRRIYAAMRAAIE